jgi:transglutaminase-like putative cysteine protease/predicted glutamine amidotransferase
MPNLLAMSFEGELAPCFDLRCLARDAGDKYKKLPDGWGIGFYPGGEPSATVLKEAAPPQGSIRSEIVKVWEHLESSLFLLHIRTATWGGISDANTQPFCRSFGGRDWLLAHSGSLRQRLEPRAGSVFEPVGSTDTERVFCELLSRIAASGKRSLGDLDPATLHAWLSDLNDLGTLSLVMSDGRDLAVFADASGDGPVHMGRVTPPYERLVVGDADVAVDLTRRGAKSRKGVIVSNDPLVSETDEGAVAWQLVPPGTLLIVRQGAVLSEVSRKEAAGAPKEAAAAPNALAFRSVLARPTKAEVRRFTVRHRTAYRYTKAVERSTHLLRLEPANDKMQRLLDHQLTVSVEGQERPYEDVFGNRVRRLLLDTPFTELIIEARSRVELFDTDPLSFRPLRERSKIPLVWMPWQWHMLQPFLLPPELPESQLRELLGYAMSFVERNDYDLIDTLLDINSTINKEYYYRQGATTISTTPFEVYVSRRGVCQDFTNLYICLARLLGVPARYVCGYIYTGPKSSNQRQSEASHAWVQVYLPEVGWKGLDPTNGVLTQTEHIRVAVGRSYVDATPTSGTLYVGGGGETLEVEVRVEPSD